MATNNFIQLKYNGKVRDGNRTATTLGNELNAIIGPIDIMSPSVNVTAYGCTFGMVLSDNDYRYITRSDVMLKIGREGYSFPATPTNKNLCTVVYNA